MLAALRNYTRWTRQHGGVLTADILGSKLPIWADPENGVVKVGSEEWDPDTARMHGVRLIEAAALADGSRAIRDAST